MPRAELGNRVDPASRLRKKILEAERMRSIPVQRSLDMGFELIAFAREFNEAAERARR